MKGICGVEGIKAYGIKEGKFGLELIRASGNASGVFTSNLVRAPPIVLMEKRIRGGHLDAVIVNSGCANAYTGRQGSQDALKMGEIACVGMRSINTALERLTAGW